MLRGTGRKIEKPFPLGESPPASHALAIRDGALSNVPLEDAGKMALVRKAREVSDFAHRIHRGV
jgi:hypothetical protein